MSFTRSLTAGLSTLKSLAAVPDAGSGAPAAAPKPAAAATRRRPPPANAVRAAAAAHPPDLAALDLRTSGRLHTDVITATVNGESLAAAAAAGTVRLAWFRVRDGAHFAPLLGVHGATYLPCIDDVGARLLCRARAVADPDNSGFAETVVSMDIDPTIATRAQRFVDRGEAYYTVQLLVAMGAGADAASGVAPGDTVELHVTGVVGGGGGLQLTCTTDGAATAGDAHQGGTDAEGATVRALADVPAASRRRIRFIADPSQPSLLLMTLPAECTAAVPPARPAAVTPASGAPGGVESTGSDVPDVAPRASMAEFTAESSAGAMTAVAPNLYLPSGGGLYLRSRRALEGALHATRFF